MVSRQSGIALLIFVMALILGVGSLSAIYFINVQKKNRIQEPLNKVLILEQAKAKVLDYAIFNPEIYSTNAAGTPDLMENIPGPGYFPCPDTNNDGSPNTPCGGGATIVEIGRLPARIVSRDVEFIENSFERNFIWYAVDERFVQQRAGTFGSRFSPLNSQMAVPPRLSLNGEAEIVALLFYAGDKLGGQNGGTNIVTDFLEGENADGDEVFDSVQIYNQQNDVVVKITYQEWRDAMLKRLSNQKAGLCSNLPTAQVVHWFNQCNMHNLGDWRPGCLQDGSIPENPLGADWRNIQINGTVGCP